MIKLSSRVVRYCAGIFIGAGFLLAAPGQAYSPDTGHNNLTRISIYIYQECFKDGPYAGLDGRIIDGSVAMDVGLKDLTRKDKADKTSQQIFMVKQRAVNWHFYNPDMTDVPATRRDLYFLPKLLAFLFGVDTSVEVSSKRLWARLKDGFSSDPQQSDKLLYLGGMIHLIEDNSVPAHVIPVYHGPTSNTLAGDFKHLVDYIKLAGRNDGGMIKDPIDEMPVVQDDIVKNVDNSEIDFCAVLKARPGTPDQIRQELARETLKYIERPIENCQGIAWKTFWDSPEPSGDPYFKRYNTAYDHPAFNQSGTIPDKDGKSACSMEDNDKRYRQFARQMHLAAIRADLRLLHWAADKL